LELCPTTTLEGYKKNIHRIELELQGKLQTIGGGLKKKQDTRLKKDKSEIKENSYDKIKRMNLLFPGGVWGFTKTPVVPGIGKELFLSSITLTYFGPLGPSQNKGWPRLMV